MTQWSMDSKWIASPLPRVPALAPLAPARPAPPPLEPDAPATGEAMRPSASDSSSSAPPATSHMDKPVSPLAIGLRHLTWDWEQ